MFAWSGRNKKDMPRNRAFRGTSLDFVCRNRISLYFEQSSGKIKANNFIVLYYGDKLGSS